jgi:hypothetical protein
MKKTLLLIIGFVFFMTICGLHLRVSAQSMIIAEILNNNGDWVETNSTSFDITKNPPRSIRFRFPGTVSRGRLSINGKIKELDIISIIGVGDIYSVEIYSDENRGSYEFKDILIGNELINQTFQIAYYAPAGTNEQAYQVEHFRWRNVRSTDGSINKAVLGENNQGYIDIRIGGYENFKVGLSDNTDTIQKELERLNIPTDGTTYLLEGSGVLMLTNAGSIIYSKVDLYPNLNEARRAWEGPGMNAVFHDSLRSQWNDRIYISEFFKTPNTMIDAGVSLNFYDVSGNVIKQSDYSNKFTIQRTENRQVEIPIPDIDGYYFQYFDVRIGENFIQNEIRNNKASLLINKDTPYYDVDIFYKVIPTLEGKINLRYFDLNNKQIGTAETKSYTFLENAKATPNPVIPIKAISGYSFSHFNVLGIYQNRTNNPIDFGILDLVIEKSTPNYAIDVFYREYVPIDLGVEIKRFTQEATVPFLGQLRNIEVDFDVQLLQGYDIPSDFEYVVKFNNSIKESGIIHREELGPNRPRATRNVVISAPVVGYNEIRVEINGERKIEEIRYDNNSAVKSFNTKASVLSNLCVFGGGVNRTFNQIFRRNVSWTVNEPFWLSIPNHPFGGVYIPYWWVSKSAVVTRDASISEKVSITGIRYRSKMTKDIMELVNYGKPPAGYNNNMHVGDNWFDIMRSANDYAYIKAGYGFELRVDLEFETNAPQVFNSMRNWIPTRRGGYDSIGNLIPDSYTLPELPNKLVLTLPAQNQINKNVINGDILNQRSNNSGNNLFSGHKIESIEMEIVPGSIVRDTNNGKLKATYQLPMNPAFRNLREYYIPDEAGDIDIYFFVTNGFEGGCMQVTFSPAGSKADGNQTFNTGMYDSKWFKIKVGGSRFEDLNVVR